MGRHFRELLEARWTEGKFVCVGLDTDIKKVPESVQGRSLRARIVAFNCAIVDAVHDLVCAFKPNIAFYAAYGIEGQRALDETIRYIKRVAPGAVVILDAKRADIGSTNEGYVEEAFGEFEADAVTVNPYFGQEALEPFLACEDKGIIVLCRTSNKGAREFQDVPVNAPVNDLEIRPCPQVPFYQLVAWRVANHWNTRGNCGVVVGATYPDELRQVRAIVGDMPILIPGIGAQGGDLEKTIAAGRDSHGRGMIVNSSRGVIYASSGPDFAEAARRETEKLHHAIVKALEG